MAQLWDVRRQNQTTTQYERINMNLFQKLFGGSKTTPPASKQQERLRTVDEDYSIANAHLDTLSFPRITPPHIGSEREKLQPILTAYQSALKVGQQLVNALPMNTRVSLLRSVAEHGASIQKRSGIEESSASSPATTQNHKTLEPPKVAPYESPKPVPSEPSKSELKPQSTASDHFWAGPAVSKNDSAVRDPVGISKKDDMMNAMVNVAGFQQGGYIRFLVTSGRIVGVWTKDFPDNATKKRFLSAYCAWKTETPGSDAGLLGLVDAHNSALMDKFEIYRVESGDGYNVRFL
jgi:hypothetical protein